MNNLSSYCGLVDAKIRASDKDLPVQKKLKAADEASREIEAASAASKSSAEKDKYKQLARRLKEERNSYRDSLDAKQKEQADLKVEMEKMSGLISELRVNCQTLQVNNFQKKSPFLPFLFLSKNLTDLGFQVSKEGIQK